MWSWKGVGWGCFLIIYEAGFVCGQGGAPLHGIAMTFLETQLTPTTNPLNFHSQFELEYTLSMVGQFSTYSKVSNQLGANQTLKIRTNWTKGDRLSMTNVMVHSLGGRYFMDSILEFSQDENAITTRIDLKIRRGFNASLNSIVTSRFFNTYELYQNDSTLIKVLKGGLLTPLIWNFSLGFGYSENSIGTITVGLTGGKLTYVREKEVFLQPSANSFYGIEKGRDYTLEYGMSLHFTVDRDLVKFLHWNCDLLLFKNYHETADLTLKNYLGFRINKYFQTKISTKILYEESLSKHIQVENLLSVGFFLKL